MKTYTENYITVQFSEPELKSIRDALESYIELMEDDLYKIAKKDYENLDTFLSQTNEYMDILS